jgi:hypothetical protein
MMTLMRNGGFPMWFIVAFGLVALGGAIRYAFRPDDARLGFVKYMAGATLFSTLTGFLADLAAVFAFFAGRRGEPALDVVKETQWPVQLMAGLAESTSPGIIGFTLLSLTALLCAVGQSRQGRQA